MRPYFLIIILWASVHCGSWSTISAHGSQQVRTRDANTLPDARIEEHAPKYLLSICAIFRNEARWLQEWIEFHKLVGVEHFYLFNNLSNDNFAEVLAPYLEAGEVDLIDWNEPFDINSDRPVEKTAQLTCYNHCLATFGADSTWMAFIDIDEFVVPVHEDSLINVLQDYEEYGALAINWNCFGTANVQHLSDDELLIERLTRCATKTHDWNRYVKCIVRTAVTEKAVDAHRFAFRANLTAVDSGKRAVRREINARRPSDRIIINHYWTRDRDWAYTVKYHRVLQRPGWCNKPAKALLWIQRAEESCNQCTDTTIQRFVPPLKNQMSFAID